MNNNKEYPIIFENKKQCCGCGACMSVCPKNAITMEEDEDGFFYPKIDKSKCIKCYNCLKVCNFKKNKDL